MLALGVAQQHRFVGAAWVQHYLVEAPQNGKKGTPLYPEGLERHDAADPIDVGTHELASQVRRREQREHRAALDLMTPWIERGAGSEVRRCFLRECEHFVLARAH